MVYNTISQLVPVSLLATSNTQGRIHGLKNEGRIMASVNNESPKAPMGWGMRRGVPSPLGEGSGEVAMPLSNFLSRSKWQVLVHSGS